MLKDLAISFFPLRLRLGRDETVFGKMGFVALLGCVETLGAQSGGCPRLQLGSGLNCNNLLGWVIIGLRVSIVGAVLTEDRALSEETGRAGTKVAKASVIPLLERSHSLGNKTATG